MTPPLKVSFKVGLNASFRYRDSDAPTSDEYHWRPSWTACSMTWKIDNRIETAPNINTVQKVYQPAESRLSL